MTAHAMQHYNTSTRAGGLRYTQHNADTDGALGVAWQKYKARRRIPARAPKLHIESRPLTEVGSTAGGLQAAALAAGPAVAARAEQRHGPSLHATSAASLPAPVGEMPFWQAT